MPLSTISLHLLWRRRFFGGIECLSKKWSNCWWLWTIAETPEETAESKKIIVVSTRVSWFHLEMFCKTPSGAQCLQLWKNIEWYTKSQTKQFTITVWWIFNCRSLEKLPPSALCVVETIIHATWFYDLFSLFSASSSCTYVEQSIWFYSGSVTTYFDGN